jgi:hypothetical protein
MGTLTEFSTNLLRISKGDVSLYERATSNFEQRVGSARSTDNVSSPPSNNAATSTNSKSK